MRHAWYGHNRTLPACVEDLPAGDTVANCGLPNGHQGVSVKIEGDPTLVNCRKCQMLLSEAEKIIKADADYKAARAAHEVASNAYFANLKQELAASRKAKPIFIETTYAGKPLTILSITNDNYIVKFGHAQTERSLRDLESHISWMNKRIETPEWQAKEEHFKTEAIEVLNEFKAYVKLINHALCERDGHIFPIGSAGSRGDCQRCGGGNGPF